VSHLEVDEAVEFCDLYAYLAKHAAVPSLVPDPESALIQMRRQAAIVRNVDTRLDRIAKGVLVVKHLGPGNHPSGSPQSEHGRKGGARSASGSPRSGPAPAPSGGEQAGQDVRSWSAAPDGEFADPSALSPYADESRRNWVQSQLSETDAVEAMDRISTLTEPVMSTPTKKGADTMAVHGVWDASGTFLSWTPQRDAWQSEVLDRVIAEQEAEAPKGHDRQVIIMAGLPGAGKTYTTEHSATFRSIFNADDYYTVNADDLKGIILDEGMEGVGPVDGLEGMELASLVHEESSHMSKTMAKRLQAEGANMILDITAANAAKVTKRIAALIADGYTVHVVHVDTHPDAARLSTVSRFARQPKGKGRPVPSGYFDSLRCGGGHSEGCDAIEENFPQLRAAANGQVLQLVSDPVGGFLPEELVSYRGYGGKYEGAR
jgi:hypothetical protein